MHHPIQMKPADSENRNGKQLNFLIFLVKKLKIENFLNQNGNYSSECCRRKSARMTCGSCSALTDPSRNAPSCATTTTSVEVSIPYPNPFHYSHLFIYLLLLFRRCSLSRERERDIQLSIPLLIFCNFLKKNVVVVVLLLLLS